MANYLRAHLSHSRFEEVDFTRLHLHNVYLQDTVIRGAWPGSRKGRLMGL